MASLEGVRVLIVEDDWLQASELAWQFTDLGAVVIGPATSVEAGMKLAPTADMAILDINICGEAVFPIADSLHDRGAPIVFYSAYSNIRIPERFHFASRLNKPASVARVRHVARSALDDLNVRENDVVRVLPRLRLAARMLMEGTEAADRLVEAVLEQAIRTGQPSGEDVESWLTRLLVETAEVRGKELLT